MVHCEGVRLLRQSASKQRGAFQPHVAAHPDTSGLHGRQRGPRPGKQAGEGAPGLGSQGAGRFASEGETSPGLTERTLLDASHVAEFSRGRAFSSLEGHIPSWGPTHLTSPKPGDFPKASPPSCTGLRTAAQERWWARATDTRLVPIRLWPCF